MTIADAIYLLCAATSLTAAALLLRQYRARKSPLLLWSCIGFFGLSVNNALVVADFFFYPGRDLSVARSLAGAIAMVVLVYGLIWEAEA